ncbi:MAG: serine/threonine protein kinase [Kiritimatiellae bacterium]|nr:serine/threonine protein kinase [Kiritimatiellia bacterium]
MASRRWRRGDAELYAFLDAHAPIASRASIADGTVVGSWRIAAFLGRGGSSEVYRGIHRSLRLAAAVKVLARGDEAARARFEREARFLHENGSPSFPRLLGAGEHEGRPFIAVELLEPAELPHDDSSVASYILSVAGAVRELHAKGLVHRDLKPQNIMLRKDGSLVIIDFGLIKAASSPGSPHPPSVSVVGGRTVGVGTPGYAAPEQLVGDAVSPATDIHALGVLLNECFGGNPPRCWARIVRRSASSIPGQRYQDVGEFIRAVRSRHRAERFLLAALAVLLASAVAAFAWWRIESDRMRAEEERRELEERLQREHDEINEMLMLDVY